MAKNPAIGRDYPLSTSPDSTQYASKPAQVIQAARAGRAENIRAKGEAKAQKIKARAEAFRVREETKAKYK